MPQQIITYMFIPATKRRFIDRAVKGEANGPDWFIFDFEDAIRDVFDLENEGSLKLSARETLYSYLPFPKPLQERYMLRINAVNTPPFEADIAFLRATSKNPPRAVMLPKVESAEDIKALESVLPRPTLIIPLIETQKGVGNVDEILNSSDRIESFCFGHIDYFFEKNRFPVPLTAMESMELSEVIRTLIESACKNRKQYIDIGFYYRGRQADLVAHCSYLAYLNHKRTKLGKLVMHPEQIEVIRSFDLHSQVKVNVAGINETKSKDPENKEYAKKIVKAYEERPDKTVGVALMDDRIIAPQLYILAKNYLKNCRD